MYVWQCESVSIYDLPNIIWGSEPEDYSVFFQPILPLILNVVQRNFMYFMEIN